LVDPARVVMAESEVALAMVEYMLRDLGATVEHVDRERDRVREELYDVVPLERALGRQA
jgi:hypothetical protein